MDIERYPAQEPFNENMVKYHAYLLERAKGLKPIEVNYGEDPYPRRPRTAVLSWRWLD